MEIRNTAIAAAALRLKSSLVMDASQLGVSLGAVGKVIKDTAAHSPKKPNDKSHDYKHNKNPKLIAAGVAANRPPIKIYLHYQRGTDAAEGVDAIARRHQHSSANKSNQ
jgi:hypothetical protein